MRTKQQILDAITECGIVALLLLLFVPALALAVGRDLSVDEFINPDDLSSFILLDKSAIGLLPPETVGISYVDQAVWSPDGRFIAFSRRSNTIAKVAEAFDHENKQPRNLAGSLSIWDSQTGRTTLVWAGKGENVASIDWLPGTQTAVVTTSRVVPAPSQEDPNETREELTCMQVNAITKKTTTLITEDQGHNPSLNVAPNAPLAIVSSDVWLADKPSFFWLIGVGTCEKIYLPEGSGAYSVRWMEDGKTLCLYVYSDGSGKALSDGIQRHILDVEAKLFHEWQGNEAPKFYSAPDEPKSPLVALQLDTPKEFSGPVLRSLWYEHVENEKKSRVLVAPDSDLYALSPSNNKVMYRAEGALFVRRIATFPRENVQAAADSVERARIQGDLKQFAIGLRLYCEDHGGSLPGPDFKEELRRYIPTTCFDNSKLQRLHYTMDGGILDDIKNPSDTIIGYIPGPGGYGIAFADLHVRWVRELPEQINNP